MALREAVLLDGPLAGGRAYVHLFATRVPMRHILVYERPPNTLREWVRWKLWDTPPNAASHRYLLHQDDETPQSRYEHRQVRYTHDPQHIHQAAPINPIVPTSTRTPKRLPTEIVFPIQPLLQRH